VGGTSKEFCRKRKKDSKEKEKKGRKVKVEKTPNRRSKG
jgi:hypothetical protein